MTTITEMNMTKKLMEKAEKLKNKICLSTFNMTDSELIEYIAILKNTRVQIKTLYTPKKVKKIKKVVEIEKINKFTPLPIDDYLNDVEKEDENGYVQHCDYDALYSKICDFQVEDKMLKTKSEEVKIGDIVEVSNKKGQNFYKIDKINKKTFGVSKLREFQTYQSIGIDENIGVVYIEYTIDYCEKVGNIKKPKKINVVNAKCFTTFTDGVDYDDYHDDEGNRKENR